MSWQVLAPCHAETARRTRADSFFSDADSGAPHPMDFCFRVLRRPGEAIVVDTGMTGQEAASRGRRVPE